jgi:HEAT repeat protein
MVRWEDERMTGPTEQSVSTRRAAALAGHTGDSPLARRLLTDPDPGTRATALGALNRLGELSSGELLQALSDPAPTVRRRGCEESVIWSGTVGDPQEPAIALAVARLLDDENDTVVETAAWACGERPPVTTGTLDRLCTVATGHADALCREAAVAALGALGDTAGLAAILEATGDKATVRRRAMIALAPFDGPEVDAALQRGRADRDWQVRQAAEDLSS